MRIRQILCSGTEFRLLDCSYRTDADTECNQYNGSGVICSLGIKLAEPRDSHEIIISTHVRIL